MSEERPPDDERGDLPDEDSGGEGTPEPPPPPPATWAGRRAQEADDEVEEEIGSGITDEFALEGEPDEERDEAEPGSESPPEPPPPQEPPAAPPPPVDEPPDPDAPAPVEEPHAPGAPPSGEGIVESEAVESEDAGEPEGDEEPGEDAEPEEDDEPEADREPEEDEESEEHEDEGAPEEPAEPTVVVPPSSAPPAAVAGVLAAAAAGEKPPRAGLWPRFLAASLVIVISFAAATATSFLLYLTDIAEGLGGIPGVENKLKTVDGGEPQTVLILGSDIRPDIEERGRSDTTMLLRLDPDRQVLSLLSLPRDLQVNIPGYGVGKLNDAYFRGGPPKTVEVVKQLTGLEINHVVNIDFAGFAEAVNAIECVFVDVDRDYFNSNEGVFDESQKYAEIDIDAGYQQLCGFKALQYVRFRYEDNDLVRAARQQSFLREARQKVPPARLLEKRKDFIDIFTKYTTSDIKDAVAMLDVLKLFIELRDAPVRRIEFQGDLGGPDSAYVTASKPAIKTAVQQFLGEAPAPTDAATDKVETGSRPGGGGKPDGGGDEGGDGGDRGPAPDGGGDDGGPALIDASEAAERYALQFDTRLRFPVIAPLKLKQGSTYSDDSRAYTIDTYDGKHYPSYKLVFQFGGQYGVPEYYGAMGTKWDDPPILENPSETRQIGGREYLLFYEGDRLQLVGFKTPQGSYWISNTLLGTLSEEEMLGVAESMTPFSPKQ